ncbi:MAG: ABC transporter permease [Methylobacteriaceae bacterium]|nr:ABC transporter permease [Methylobacteriaceae bacterium]
MDSDTSQKPISATPSAGSRVQRRSFAEILLNVRELAPGLGLAAVVLFFTLQTRNFWSPQTMTAISTIASTIAIVSIGVTMLMICGEFDLSVGQNFAFTPIIWAILFVTNGMNEWLALAIALALAICVGMVNGLVTTIFGIPSFITTLGMFFVLQGLNNLLISGHQLIMFDPSSAISLLGARIGTTPFYMPLVWMFIIAGAFWFVLARLRYGNWTFATGGRVGPAKAMGVPTGRVKRTNFILSAFFAGLAGCMQFAYLRGVTQGQGQNYELLAITAAVLGGTSLFGGTGTIWGSVIGAFLLATIQIGLVLIGVPGSFYVTFIGVMLVIVVIANVRLGRFGTNQA